MTDRLSTSLSRLKLLRFISGFPRVQAFYLLASSTFDNAPGVM